ncbi:MAG: hypothetical protein M1484_05090 [Patescibacteria group bacterium]|nr:hypothetical protein [Patescibacteria group bacterium]
MTYVSSYVSSEGDYSFSYPKGWILGQHYVMCPWARKDNNCASGNIDLFQVTPVVTTSFEEFITNNTVYTEKTKIKFDGLDAIKAVTPYSKQAGGSTVTIFVIKNGKGYEISMRYNLQAKGSLSEFPSPDPDILSTFKFL